MDFKDFTDLQLFESRHGARLATGRGIRLYVTGLDRLVEDLIDDRDHLHSGGFVFGQNELSESLYVLLYVGLATQIEDTLLLGGAEGFLG